MSLSLKSVLLDINKCKLCSGHFKHEPRPVISASRSSKILIIGQAPGLKVHQSGITWNDKSGERLRDWMGVSSEVFYDENLISMLPMGFCYPGKAKTGDLPPRKECAPKWHQQVIDHLQNLKLIMLVGSYSQKYYLETDAPMAEIVRNNENSIYFALPHPSPRNFMWFRNNNWFEEEVLPQLKKELKWL